MHCRVSVGKLISTTESFRYGLGRSGNSNPLRIRIRGTLGKTFPRGHLPRSTGLSKRELRGNNPTLLSVYCRDDRTYLESRDRLVALFTIRVHLNMGNDGGRDGVFAQMLHPFEVGIRTMVLLVLQRTALERSPYFAWVPTDMSPRTWASYTTY